VASPWESREDLVKMNLLSAAIILTSQGIPFFQAGEEFLRSKPINVEKKEFDENSYRSPDYINSLKWDQRTINSEVINYYKGLIAFRRNHGGLRMTRTEEVETKLKFLKWLEPNVVAFVITHPTEGEICVVYNANKEGKPVHIPEGDWKVYVKGNRAGTEVLEMNTGGVVFIEPISALVLAR
jgi:pullulanase